MQALPASNQVTDNSHMDIAYKGNNLKNNPHNHLSHQSLSPDCNLNSEICPTTNCSSEFINHSNQNQSAFLKKMSGLSALIQDRLKLGDSKQFHKSFMDLAIAASIMSPWQMQECYKFASGLLDLFKGYGNKKIFTQHLLGHLRVFKESLSHYSQDCSKKPDLSYMPEMALSCSDFKIFQSCLNAHIALSNNHLMNEFQVAVRCLVRYGLQSSESALSILNELNELSKTDKFESLSRNPELTSFFRGLLLNSWNITSSLILLRSALNLNNDTEKVIFIAAQNSIKARPDGKACSVELTETSSPSVLSFLSLGNTSPKELELLTLFLYRYPEVCDKSDDKAEAKLDLVTRKLCCLIEACRYTTCVDFEEISKRVQRQVIKGQDVDSLITILLNNTLRSVDNKSARTLIEKVINSSHPDEFRYNLEILRNLHNADVPVEGQAKGYHEADRYAQQINIFKQAISCFDLFQQVRLSIPLLAAELKRMPDGSPSLLSSFAYEVARVNNLFATENAYPGHGIEFFDFDTASLFETDPENPADPLHRYYQTQGWSRQAVEDFLNSKIVVLENMLIFSLRTNDALKFAGQDMCLVFYADTAQNYASDQCLLLPASLVEECLKLSRYDFMDLADQSSQLVSLSESGLRSEDLRLEAQKLAMPIFDIGSATNIGGLSNSTGEFRLEPQNRYHLDRIFGLDSVDPWGNVKKMNLLQFPELFTAHTSLHENLVGVFSRFAQAYKIFENRYSAWKKGATPVVENTDREWFGSLSASSQNYRMLSVAYSWHIHQRLNKDSDSLAKICFYSHGKFQNGSNKDFIFDISSLQLHTGGEIIQFPVPENLSRKVNLDNFIEQFILNTAAASQWDVYVRPAMSGQIPFLQFY